MRYALVKDGQIVRFDANIDPNVETKPGVVWLPAPPTTPPDYDPVTEVLNSPVYNITANGVTETWSKRAKTAGELSTDKDLRVNAVDALQFQVLFNHENRIRVLEGKAAITATQFRAALKALL